MPSVCNENALLWFHHLILLDTIYIELFCHFFSPIVSLFSPQNRKNARQCSIHSFLKFCLWSSLSEKTACSMETSEFLSETVACVVEFTDQIISCKCYFSTQNQAAAMYLSSEGKKLLLPMFAGRKLRFLIGSHEGFLCLFCSGWCDFLPRNLSLFAQRTPTHVEGIRHCNFAFENFFHWNNGSVPCWKVKSG